MKIFIPFKVAAFVLLFPTSESVSYLDLGSRFAAREAPANSEIAASPALALPSRTGAAAQRNLLIAPQRGSEVSTSPALTESIASSGAARVVPGCPSGTRIVADPIALSPAAVVAQGQLSRPPCVGSLVAIQGDSAALGWGGKPMVSSGVVSGTLVTPLQIAPVNFGPSISTLFPTSHPPRHGLVSRLGFSSLLAEMSFGNEMGANGVTYTNWTSSGDDVVSTDRDSPKDPILKRREPATTSDELVFRGVVNRAVAPALRQAAVRADLIDDFVDLFSNSVDFRRDIHRGDSFSLFVKRDVAKNSYFISAASLKTRGKLLVAVRHVGADGVARYFDARGFPLGEGLLRYPVQFTRISSVFSDSRLHPVLKINRPHLGVDFAAPVGTPVRAAGDGVVTFAGRHGAGGITIKIQHDSRYATSYLHLSRIEQGVYPKMRVRKGQIIGAVGKTGLATGAHLHFSLWDRGRYIDPLKAKIMPAVHRRDMIPQKLLLARVESLKALHSGAIAVALNKRDGSRAG